MKEVYVLYYEGKPVKAFFNKEEADHVFLGWELQGFKDIYYREEEVHEHAQEITMHAGRYGVDYTLEIN